MQKLNSFEDSQDIIKFGIETIMSLCEKLYAYGAPSIHFYTVNMLEPTKTIIKLLK